MNKSAHVIRIGMRFPSFLAEEVWVSIIGRTCTAFVVKCFNYLRAGGRETPTFEIEIAPGVLETHRAAVETDGDKLKLAVNPVGGPNTPLVVGTSPRLDDVTIDAQDFLEHNDLVLKQEKELTEQLG